jgi:spore coat polysaccharide biosynthesis predicted glycosyltransferase SpsG
VLDREEAVDIDTFHDWWLAEKVLNRLRIVFHVIGSPANGLGHVYRALTLSRRLSDHEIFFLCAESENQAAKLLGEAGCDVHVYRESPIGTLAWLEPDIVVNDVLDTDAELIGTMRQSGWRVVNFEDLGSGVAEADVVINALYEAPHPSPHVHTGADFYCLREEFFTASRRDAADEVRRVLLCFGGTDPSRLTLRALEALQAIDGEFETDVVVGPGYEDPGEVRRFAEGIGGGIRIIQKTKVMSQYMEQADLMLTSGGRTVYEAASIGVPTVVLCQNDRELEHLFASPANGFLNLGLGRDVPVLRLAEEIRALMADAGRRRDMQRRMWRWDAHAGIERVLALILGSD